MPTALEKLVDLGLVGEVEKLDTRILEILLTDNFIPVVAPIGVTSDGVSLNLNADTAAGSSPPPCARPADLSDRRSGSFEGRAGRGQRDFDG